MGSSATYAYDNWDELEAKRKCPIRKARDEKRKKAIRVAERTSHKLVEILEGLPEDQWHKIKSVKVNHNG